MDEMSLAKIARPRLQRIHQRTDLLSLLDELRAAPLIMVSGLRGAGKSTLVASYAETRHIPCLWYRMDHNDEDLANFFHHLDLAVRGLKHFKKDEMPSPMPGCLDGDAAAVSGYFDDIYRRLETPFLMVFDEYQNVSEGAAVQRVIRDACAALPVGGRIILIGNSEYPPTVACLRANGSTAIVGWQELQLNPAKIKEAAALRGLTLPREDAIRQMQRKVGVWAAALVLSLQRTHAD